MTSAEPSRVESTSSSRLERWVAGLSRPVDAASLAVFRIVFGVVALVEVYRYFSHGWIQRYWVAPESHFTYVGFGWVRPLPETAMHVLWMVLGIAALGIAVGAFYRASCVVFALGFGYSFLIEAARYLNHFYLIALLAALLAFVPADRVWSVDAWSRRRPTNLSVPAWALRLLQFQIGVVYVYGAIAKIESDWLRGEPMSTWLAREGDRPLVGGLLVRDGAGPALAWAGLAFDLLIVFAVAWRRTRIPALVGAAAFHLINNELFHIGVFPYLAFAALLLFCDPGWPRALLSRLRGGPWEHPPVPELGPAETTPRSRTRTRIAVVLVVAFAAFQLLVPLRHLLSPGKSNWTEAGHTFAWHMKLRIKDGSATFVVVDPATGNRTVVDPRFDLTSWQYSKMAIRPEMIRQFAHQLADRFAEEGVPDVQVYAQTTAVLNGRPPQPLVDPAVDLAAESPSLTTPDWVVPLRHPLP